MREPPFHYLKTIEVLISKEIIMYHEKGFLNKTRLEKIEKEFKNLNKTRNKDIELKFSGTKEDKYKTLLTLQIQILSEKINKKT
jgi:hypothetical protein